jgi:hypothetical protein
LLEHLSGSTLFREGRDLFDFVDFHLYGDSDENLQALAAGISMTACWKLAPEVPNYEDPLSIMELFYGKLC